MGNQVSPERLEARGICVHFEGLKAIHEVDISVNANEIVGLIGPNGAGKTTMLNVLSGFQVPTYGKVMLDEVEISARNPEWLARNGLARTFQGVRLFPTMSVLENVELGAIGKGVGIGKARKLAIEVLDALGLLPRSHVLAASLSHGEERLVGVARALAVEPRFLLLDEPGAGLNEEESVELLETLRKLHREFDVSILIVEHDMRLIMPLCGRLHVLDHGSTLAEGTPEEIRRHPAVLEAYLGTGDKDVLA